MSMHWAHSTIDSVWGACMEHNEHLHMGNVEKTRIRKGDTGRSGMRPLATYCSAEQGKGTHETGNSQVLVKLTSLHGPPSSIPIPSVHRLLHAAIHRSSRSSSSSIAQPIKTSACASAASSSLAATFSGLEDDRPVEASQLAAVDAMMDEEDATLPMNALNADRCSEAARLG